jgi:hypothetical protein
MGTTKWKELKSRFPDVVTSDAWKKMVREHLEDRNKYILNDKETDDLFEKFSKKKGILLKGKEEPEKQKETKAWYTKLWELPKKIFEASRDVTSFRDGGHIPVMHDGGIKRTTGLAYLEKGEIVLPKQFAEGGTVTNELASVVGAHPTAQSLNMKVEIDTSKLEEVIERGIEVNIDDTVKVGVDTADATVGVDPDAKVNVDTSGMATELATAVRDATTDITVKIEGGGVGAAENDALARVAESVDKVNNSLITVKRELEERIEMVGGIDEATVSIMINEIEGKIQTELNSDIRTNVDGLRRELTQQKQINDYRVEELNYLINNLKTKVS